MERLSSFLQEIKYYIGFIMFGGAGGIVYLALSGRDFCLKAVLKAFFVSAFVGLLCGILAQYVGVAVSVACALAGLFGFAGGIALIWVLALVQKKFGLATDDDLERLKDDIHRNRPAECVLTDLVRHRAITMKDYKAVLDGRFDALVELVMKGTLDGAVFEDIVRWSHSMHVVGNKE